LGKAYAEEGGSPLERGMLEKPHQRRAGDRSQWGLRIAEGEAEFRRGQHLPVGKKKCIEI